MHKRLNILFSLFILILLIGVLGCSQNNSKDIVVPTQEPPFGDPNNNLKYFENQIDFGCVNLLPVHWGCTSYDRNMRIYYDNSWSEDNNECYISSYSMYRDITGVYNLDFDEVTSMFEETLGLLQNKYNSTMILEWLMGEGWELADFNKGEDLYMQIDNLVTVLTVEDDSVELRVCHCKNCDDIVTTSNLPKPPPTSTPQPTFTPYGSNTVGNVTFSLPRGEGWCWDDLIFIPSEPGIQEFTIDSNCENSTNPSIIIEFYYMEDVKFISNKKSVDYYFENFLKDRYQDQFGTPLYRFESIKLIKNIEYDYIGTVTYAEILMLWIAEATYQNNFIVTFEYLDDIYYFHTYYDWWDGRDYEKNPILIDGLLKSEFDDFIYNTYNQLLTSSSVIE